MIIVATASTSKAQRRPNPIAFAPNEPNPPTIAPDKTNPIGLAPNEPNPPTVAPDKTNPIVFAPTEPNRPRADRTQSLAGKAKTNPILSGKQPVPPRVSG
jgi:hypothetical protein